MALTTKFYSFAFTTSTYSTLLSFSSTYTTMPVVSIDVSMSSLGYSSTGSYIIYTVPSGKTAKVYLNNFRGYFSGSLSGPASISTTSSTSGMGIQVLVSHVVNCYLAANVNNIVFTDSALINSSILVSLAATTSAGANAGVSFSRSISGNPGLSDFWHRSFSLTTGAAPIWDRSYTDLTFYMGPNQSLAMYYILFGKTDAEISAYNSSSVIIGGAVTPVWFANVSTTMAHTLSGQLLVIEEDASAPT